MLIGCVSIVIDLYCILSVSLLSCCSLLIELHSDFSSLSCFVFCIAHEHFKNTWHFKFIAPLLPGPFRLLSLPFLSFLTPPSFLSPQLVCELLHEGQVISVGVSAESGRGGQWLARIRQLIKEGSVPDVSLVPVGISYDNMPKTNIQVDVCKCTLESTHLIRPNCYCNVPRPREQILFTSGIFRLKFSDAPQRKRRCEVKIQWEQVCGSVVKPTGSQLL